MCAVVSYPPLPFWHALPGGLNPGKMVEIRGTVPHGCESFQINFTAGMDSGGYTADRIFHLSIRPTQRLVVRNTLSAGNWEAEERNGAFPFVAGKQFTILILVEGASYRVAVNGQHQWEFFHRHPVDRARMLFIDGSVRIEEVRIFEKQPPVPSFPVSPQSQSVTINSPKLPFSGKLPAPLQMGSVIEINGCVPPNAEVFQINLANDADGLMKAERSLHISVRFKHKVVVRNSFRNNDWENEERSGPFAFRDGSCFTMTVLVDKYCYRISVNGYHCWEFQHRFPFSAVKWLFVSGAIVVDTIRHIPPQSLKNRPNGMEVHNNLSSLSDHLPILNPENPYYHEFPDGLKPGFMVFIKGRPNQNAERFTINLVCHNIRQTPPFDDTALHFDARFFNRTVVRNTQIHGQWLEEETMSPYFPFGPGFPFDLAIIVDPDKYLIAINGQHFCYYMHQIKNLEKINRFHVGKDVKISCISFSMP